jgi:ribosomal protein S12 methylthiotransferase accessory factor YcaO
MPTMPTLNSRIRQSRDADSSRRCERTMPKNRTTELQGLGDCVDIVRVSYCSSWTAGAVEESVAQGVGSSAEEAAVGARACAR